MLTLPSQDAHATNTMLPRLSAGGMSGVKLVSHRYFCQAKQAHDGWHATRVVAKNWNTFLYQWLDLHAACDCSRNLDGNERKFVYGRMPRKDPSAISVNSLPSAFTTHNEAGAFSSCGKKCTRIVSSSSQASGA